MISAEELDRLEAMISVDGRTMLHLRRDTALRLIAATRAVQPDAEWWRPIESAPESTSVLVIGPAWRSGGTWARWPHPFSPTHWRPLPATPVQTQGDEGWRPVGEAPLTTAPVLCFGSRASWAGGYSILTGADLHRHPGEGVTHWRSFPTPPVQTQGGEG